MFGLVRFFLSYLVVLSHLTGSVYAEHFGFYAVRAFFVISGFLMTSALHEVYRFDGVRFWTNRLLRLLPPYYFVCLLTLAAIILLPSAAEQFHWRHSGSVAEWTSEVMANLLVFPLHFPSPEFRLVPPYWSVAVELEMLSVRWSCWPPALSFTSPTSTPGWSGIRPVARFDRALGEIAYPVFLVQWLVGFLVAVTFFPGTQRGWLLTLVATPFIIAAGFALALVNRRFVEPVRLRLRETPRESPLALDGATARAG
jgi:peptidoglycan/LPS O-acetylase OafA/YrhL